MLVNYFSWISIILAVMLVIYTFFHILTPFLIAFIIGYLLEPLIQKLIKNLGFSRPKVVTGLFIFLILLISLIMIWLLPVIYQELILLFAKIPEYSQYLQSAIAPYVYDKLDNLSPALADKVSVAIKEGIKSLATVLLNQVASFWNYTLATINFFVLLIIMLLSLFYFMYNWPILVKEIMDLVPVRYRSNFNQLLNNIDLVISRYFKGQFTVCAIFMAYYTVGLKLIGLNGAILLGSISGCAIIIPFIGIPCALGISLMICYNTFGWNMQMIYILILYSAGNMLDSGIITPKIVGDKIGLHPLWLIFAVIAAGGILGISGVILAVPLAGVAKVLMHAIIRAYKSSKLYLE